MAKTFSGSALIAILVRQFGFVVVRQRGGHVTLRRRTAQGTITTVVPLHRELAYGTLKGALDLAQVDMDDFLEAIRRR